MPESPQSGIRGIDALVDGLRVGDNVVWLAPRRLWGSVLNPFIDATIQRGLCYMTVESLPEDVVATLRRIPESGSLTVVDCRPDAARSVNAEILDGIDVRAVERPLDLGSAQVLMKDLEDELGRGIGYVFDSLTAMQQLWGADGALAFFLRHCPRLYDLDTVAYWVLDPTEHDLSFIERIKEVTQVIFEISEESDALTVRVVKADARGPEVVGRTARLEESSGALRVSRTEPTRQVPLGELLKRRRMERGMSQSELARRLKITPSALSQAEHGKRGLSAETMKLAWKELGVGDDAGEDDARPSYVVARRGARTLERVLAGVEGERVMERPSGFEVHLMAFAPGSSGRRPPLATKRPEFVLVAEGVLQLRIGDSKVVLHAGDAIYIGTQPLSGWRNPSPTVTRALWAVVP